MTATERHERARNLCRRLSHDVAAVAPLGIGRWGPAWDIVESASTSFLDSLDAWERREGDVGDVREAYDAVVEAWRMAAAEYQGAAGGRGVPA